MSNMAYVTLHISSWSASKNLREEARNIEYDKDATRGTVAARCRIIDKDLKAVNAAIRKVRETHHELTLQCSPEMGAPRVLPAKMLRPYMDKMNRKRRDAKALIDDFVHNQYPLIKERRRIEMGKLFDESDFPTQAEILDKYSISWEIVPAPLDSSFSEGFFDYAQELEDAVRSEFEQTANGLETKAMKDLSARVVEKVEETARKLVTYEENLSEYYRIPESDRNPRSKPRFHESAISTLVEFAELIPGLNIADDENLIKIQEMINKEVASYDAECIRENSENRTQFAEVLDEILGLCS